MTTRKFNYTGRRKLLREDVSISLEASEQGQYTFEVGADLGSYNFPGDAVLVAEAYERSRFERFELGRLGDVSFPVSRELQLFRLGEAVKFRLKVIGTGGLGARLLGEADQLVPTFTEGSAGGGRVALLRTEGMNLGEKVWELSLIDQPLLRFNTRLGDWRALATSQEFAMIAYPVILERILEHVVIELRQTPESDLSEWEQLWLRFAARQPGVPDFPGRPGEDDANLRDWIDAAVAGFSRKNSFLRVAAQFCAGETTQ
jgi:hypothetical protein